MQHHTFPAGSLHNISDDMTVPALICGPFAVHKRIVGPGVAGDDYVVTHRHTHSSSVPGRGGFQRRRDAVAFAEYLASLPVNWDQSDAQNICREFLEVMTITELTHIKGWMEDGYRPHPPAE